ncbi:PREDICTED: peroxisomal membrane protein 11B-like [Branchiostoma belcheri]|uniref:Peroxisomal membrane protein 11B-like n=1 Tax=Branchiostoma belcheri TaxID=7741 RepID=A0A6P4Z0D2_BRABE|nr:PREDICTED: peroxisomal membrane protein 11B-like [Branchiostoma belcheri]
MEAFINFTAQTKGRDKLFRTVQYGSIFLRAVFGRTNTDVVTKMKKLESQVSMTRKLMRFGKSLDSLEAARRASKLQDELLRVLLTASHANRSVFLLFDHLVWLGRAGVIQTDVDMWNWLSLRFWFLSTLLSLLRDLYGIQKALQIKHQQLNYPNGTVHNELRLEAKVRQEALRRILVENLPLCIDTSKNVCDIVVQMTRLKLIEVSDGWVGFCGVVSSILGIMVIADPTLKLTPS